MAGLEFDAGYLMVKGHTFLPRRSVSDDYWSSARAPLSCLIFVLPWLAIYEAGVLLMGGANPEGLRNGADYWMRDWLQQQGNQIPFLLPFLVVFCLLTWHLAGKFPWRVRAETFVGMAAESLLFACLLLLIAHGHDWLFRTYFDPVFAPLSLAVSSRSLFQEHAARGISYLGAGIYEEVLFRLLALPLGQLIFRGLLVPRRYCMFVSVVATSLVFAAAHYVGPTADTLTAFSFLFRLLAGLFFSVLFVLRGFGITVGAHAGYDLMVGILLR